MSHPDEETLVAFALGEDVEADVAAHVESCASCRTEVRGTTDVVRATRGLDQLPLALENPPDQVWTAITDELARDRRRPATGVRRAPSYLVRPQETRAAGPWWQSPKSAAIAAAGIVVGAAAALLVLLVLPEPKSAVPEAPALLAAGRLVPLKGETANGSVQVYDRDGERTVTVRLRESEVKDDEYVEAWIFEPGTSKMVSLGVMDQATQTFSVPSGLNLGVYSAIDISAEPLNGDPAHSTKSMARGELESLSDGPEAAGAAEQRRPLARAGMYDVETQEATRRYLLHFPGLDDERPVELQARGVEAGQSHQTTLTSTGKVSGDVRPAAQTTTEPAAKPDPQASKGGSRTDAPVPGSVAQQQTTKQQTTKQHATKQHAGGLGACRANGRTQVDTSVIGGVVAVLREVGLLPRPAAPAQPERCLRAGGGSRDARARPAPAVTLPPAQQGHKVVRPADQQARRPAVRDQATKRHPAAKDNRRAGRGGRHHGQHTADRPQRPQSGFWFGSGGSGWFS